MQTQEKRIASAGRIVSLVLIAIAGAAVLAPGAQAQNAEFQDFFFDVCQLGSPSGDLAAHCAETPAGSGDLSGDSESSLNPGQFLEANQAALARARIANKDVQERLENKRKVTSAPRWGIFGHLNFESSDRDASALQRGFDADQSGFQLGFDYRLSDRAFVGVLVSYESTDSEFDPDQPGMNFVPPATDGETDADGFQLTVFGSRDLGRNLWLDGSVGFGQTDYEYTRNAVFQESMRTVPQTDVAAVARTDGDELSASLGFGHDYNRRAFGGSAYVRMSYARSEVDAFREDEAGGLQMQVDAASRRSLVGTLGWRGTYSFSTSWGVLVPHVRIEYEHEFEDDPQSVATRFTLDAAQTLYTINGERPDGETFNTAIGLLAVAPRGWSAFVDLEVLLGDSFLDRQRLTFGVRKEL